METIKISKFLSQCGIASRRKSEDLVRQGLVAINGKTEKNPAIRINPQTDKIAYNGKIISAKPLAYYLLYKPLGYTSTASDPHAKDLVCDLVPKEPKVFPVGRLDKETSGVLLMTNDGAFIQQLTHPSYEIKKEYIITSNIPLSEDEILKIRKGILLEDGFIKPDLFEKISGLEYRIAIHEGRKRLVRRIMEHMHRKTAALCRVNFAGITSTNLKPGQWRKLLPKEVLALKKIKNPPKKRAY